MSQPSVTWVDAGTIFIALWGAALSTILAGKRMRGESPRLAIHGQAEPPFEEIQFQLSNPSKRSVPIQRAQLKYGLDPKHSQTVLEIESLKDAQFEPDAGRGGSISVAELREAARTKGIKQGEYCRLWLVVEAFGGRRYRGIVQVDEAIITSPYLRSAGYFIATDLLLGFPQMVSYVHDHWKVK